MEEPQGTSGTQDVPRRVFEEFLRALSDADVSTEVVTRLRKTLLETGVITEKSLKDAVLAEDPLP